VILAGDPVTVAGTKDIEFTGSVTNSGGTRNVVNELTDGAVLTLSGGVNLSNDATNRILILRGAGHTLINSAIVNGSTSTAGALTMRGTGTAELTAANRPHQTTGPRSNWLL
jgi:hypothetical protein